MSAVLMHCIHYLFIYSFIHLCIYYQLSTRSANHKPHDHNDNTRMLKAKKQKHKNDLYGAQTLNMHIGQSIVIIVAIRQLLW